MQISMCKIQEFQSLYKQRFGIELSKEDALEKATKLIRLMQLVYSPITKTQLEKLKLYDEQQRNDARGNGRIFSRQE